LAVAPHVASHHLSRILDELREAKRVRAVVLRINSPGGSALASELIWHAVKRLAAAKPIVVSMGDVAASGGYYIASPATRILAQPYTLTGSIGVVGGKFSLAGLFEKIGITSETLHRGARADLFNLARAWTPSERQVIQNLMARTYRQFVSRVAAGRKLPVAKVQQAAQGRIWCGTDARKQGLVDQLGGLLDAVAEAKRLSKLPRDAKTAVYPRPKTWLERLQEGLGGDRARVHLLHSLLALGPLESHRLRDLLTLLRQWQREVALAWMPVFVRVR
jgi:protease-4